jgi:hypothetical protein
MHNRPGNILIAMNIIGNIDIIGRKNLISDLYLSHGGNMVVISKYATLPNP